MEGPAEEAQLRSVAAAAMIAAAAAVAAIAPSFVVVMEGPAEEVFLKSAAAAQFWFDGVKVKEHSCRLAFAMNDFKLQGRALPKLILSICKRPTPPWMEFAGFHVLISRARTIKGLRVLNRDEQGLAHLRALQWKSQLGAWMQG